MLATLKQRCPSVRISGQEGGLHIVLTTGQPARDKQLVAQLSKLGVAFQTVRAFGGNGNEVLLGYGHMNTRDIEHSVGLLGQALSQLRRPREGVRLAV